MDGKSGMTGKHHNTSISSEFYDDYHHGRLNNSIHISEPFPTIPVNGIWHRAPSGTSQYIFHGYNYDAKNYESFCYELAEGDAISTENLPNTDPFVSFYINFIVFINFF